MEGKGRNQGLLERPLMAQGKRVCFNTLDDMQIVQQWTKDMRAKAEGIWEERVFPLEHWPTVAQ